MVQGENDDGTKDLQALRHLRATLEAVRQMTEGIRDDIESSIVNHKQLKGTTTTGDAIILLQVLTR